MGQKPLYVVGLVVGTPVIIGIYGKPTVDVEILEGCPKSILPEANVIKLLPLGSLYKHCPVVI